MTTYFLSYARADDKSALRFADDLLAAGVSVWVDQYDIRPSQHWDRAIEAAIRACDGLIVILSPASVASPNVADEVSVAINDGKAVIPIMIAPCVLPLRMTRMHFIDATRDYETALRRTLAALEDTAQPASRTEGGQAADLPSELSAEALALAQRRLTGFIGPIARVLVLQAARGAASEADLYTGLAASLPTQAERESFLGWLKEPDARRSPSPPRAQPAGDARLDISGETLALVTAALTLHIGPIAPRLVQRERAQAASHKALCEQLAAHIPSPIDRAAFLKAVGAG
jgi:hypothetical protein